MKRLLALLLFALPCQGQINPLFFQSAFNTQPVAGTPGFAPGAGAVVSGTTITITASPSTAICYNFTGAPATNGTTGCTTGTLYTTPVAITTAETLYAVAGGTGYQDSSVASAAYTILVVPVVLQSAISASDGSFNASLPNHASGGLSCVLYWGTNNAAPSAIANTAGFVWTAQGTAYNAANIDAYLQAWCAPKLVYVSTDTVTVTSSGFSGCIAFLDISNVTTLDNPSPPYGAAGAGGAPSTVSTGNFTVTGTSDMLFGIGSQPSNTVTIGSGFTTIVNATAGCNTKHVMMEYEVLSGTTANASMGVTTFNGWGILGVAIK